MLLSDHGRISAAELDALVEGLNLIYKWGFRGVFSLYQFPCSFLLGVFYDFWCKKAEG